MKEIITPKPNIIDDGISGYTDDHILTFMDAKEYAAFNKWMNGQTCGMVNGQYVMYECDVLRFRQLYHNGTPTYWD